MAADFTFSSITPIAVPPPEEVIRSINGPFAQSVDQSMTIVARRFPSKLRIVDLGGGGSGGSDSRPTSGFLYPRGDG